MDKSIAKNYVSLGLTYYKLKNFSESLIYLRKAVDYYENVNGK